VPATWGEAIVQAAQATVNGGMTVGVDSAAALSVHALVPDSPGLNPVTVDFEPKRGIWIEAERSRCRWFPARRSLASLLTRSKCLELALNWD
jgi:hypothetical protein